MNKNLTYINCKKCNSLFKIKSDNKQVNNSICIFCGEPISYASRSVTRNTTPKLKFQATALQNTVNKTVADTNLKSKSSLYLKKFKLKQYLFTFGWLFALPVAFSLVTYNILIYKNEISQDKLWRNELVLFCNIFKCSLPTYKNVNEIIMVSNNIETDNIEKNTIKLNAVLNNIAMFDQAFPDLTINFTNINGQIIAKRDIKHLQYLKNNNKNYTSKLFKKNSKYHLSVTLDDPGPEAYGFEITLN